MKVYNKLRGQDRMMLFFLFVLAFDVLIVLLSISGFYFTFIKPTNNILPILLTLVVFYAVAWVRKIERFWVIAATITVFLILGGFSLTNNSYATIESPTGNVKVMIGHRDITLGETNHFYNFYLYTVIPGVMKKVNGDTIHIMTRGTSEGNLEVLGVDGAEWVNDEKVIFHSPYEVTEVELKHWGIRDTIKYFFIELPGARDKFCDKCLSA